LFFESVRRLSGDWVTDDRMNEAQEACRGEEPPARQGDLSGLDGWIL
jgi:hypothetical protein